MRTLLLGDIGNRLDIEDAERSISALNRNQQKTVKNLHARDREISQLKGELEQQKLAIQALSRFLVEKKIVDEKELQEFIEVVDAEDGVVDGKMTIDTSDKPRLVFLPEKKIPKGTFKTQLPNS